MCMSMYMCVRVHVCEGGTLANLQGQTAHHFPCIILLRTAVPLFEITEFLTRFLLLQLKAALGQCLSKAGEAAQPPPWLPVAAGCSLPLPVLLDLSWSY